MRRLLVGETGQATGEFALFTALAITGVGFGLLGFLPMTLEALEIYLGGLWLVLGLPGP